MKYLILTLLMSPSLFAASFNLEEVYEHALKHHPKAKIFKSELKELNLGLGKVKSLYYPEVNAIVGGEIQNGGSESELNNERLVAELRVKYNIYRFGQTKNESQAFKYLIEKKQDDFNWWLFYLRSQLEKSFYEAVTIKKQMAILKDEISQNNKLLAMTAKRRKSGLVGESDVLEVKQRKTLLEVRIVELEESLDHFLDEIRQVAYLDHKTQVLLDRPLPHFHIELDLNDLVAKTKSFNKKIKDSIFLQKSIEQEQEKVKKQRLPEVNFMGRYGNMRIDENYTTSSTEGLFGVYVDIPIFDGGNRKSTHEIYVEKYKQKVLALKLQKNQFAVEVTHKYEIFNRTHVKLKLLEKSYQQGVRYFKNVVSEYNRGIKSSLDLVSAREHLLEINLNLIKTKGLYLSNIFEIEQLIGQKIQEKI